jgi:hypothetical protein
MSMIDDKNQGIQGISQAEKAGEEIVQRAYLK